MCAKDAKETCAKMFPDALYIEYTDPGYTLFKKVYDRIGEWKKARGCEPQVIFLQNHGIFVAADSTEEIDAIYAGVMGKLEAAVKPLPEGEAAISDDVTEVIPAVRTFLSRKGRGLKTLQVTNNALVQEFTANFAAVKAPFTPDAIVYCKSEFIHVSGKDAADTVKQAEKKIEAYIEKRGHCPKVLLIDGIGLVAAADNSRGAQITTDVFLDAMKVAWYAQSFGGEHPMNARQIGFIGNWEV
jgi:rhamnose utilization protein RhaD (predicted bifunctional aldolase and dehydrogenase)